MGKQSRENTFFTFQTSVSSLGRAKAFQSSRQPRATELWSVWRPAPATTPIRSPICVLNGSE